MAVCAATTLTTSDSSAWSKSWVWRLPARRSSCSEPAEAPAPRQVWCWATWARSWCPSAAQARSTTTTSHGSPTPRCSSTAPLPACSPTAPTRLARSRASTRSRASSISSTTPPARDSCSRPSVAASPASAVCSCLWPRRRKPSSAIPARSPRASASWT